mmetsp:Transcript_17070/g.55637  ORF Transcript_17070/g.55637 Transcript_17070/m.55637 type:complete len:222 (+) Transcript_17070:4636-5301(+)
MQQQQHKPPVAAAAMMAASVALLPTPRVRKAASGGGGAEGGGLGGESSTYHVTTGCRLSDTPELGTACSIKAWAASIDPPTELSAASTSCVTLKTCSAPRSVHSASSAGTATTRARVDPASHWAPTKLDGTPRTSAKRSRIELSADWPMPAAGISSPRSTRTHGVVTSTKGGLRGGLPGGVGAAGGGKDDAQTGANEEAPSSPSMSHEPSPTPTAPAHVSA